VPAGFTFCGFCGAALTATREPQTELRDVSVIFADMKGFTAMSERMDPEDVQAVMNECFKGLGRAVKEEDGQVNKYSGDCIMAQFGAPLAHEDDPARACRAALAMQAFLHDYARGIEAAHGVTVLLRIGIHCGMVAAGGVGDEQVHQAYDILGDTVNLAQRLESAAEPGTILVSEEVARRVHGQFRFGDARQITVKGKRLPVTARQLLALSAEPPGRGDDGISVELIGRAELAGKLQAFWESDAPETGRIVIHGEMGVGKTRLVEHVQELVAGGKTLHVPASPLVCRRPFGLVRRLIRATAAATGEDQDPFRDRESFQRFLSTADEELKFCADALWFLAATEPAPAPDPDAATLRALVQRGWVGFLRDASRRHARLTVVIDSYDAADPESAELVRSLGVNRGRDGVRFLLTSRSQEAAADYECALAVPPLPPQESRELLDRLVRGAILPPPLRQSILQRAGGVPLFLEEMVRALLEAGLIERQQDSVWEFREQAGAAVPELPSSLRAAMVARVDRLRPALREILRLASVQGSEFDAGILERACAGRGERYDVNELLRELSLLNLLQPVDGAGGTRYLFRNPLLAEACYATMTRRDRKQLHEETLEACRLAAAQGGELDPEVIAHHAEHAERWLEAAEARKRAGCRAAELHSNHQAITHLQAATHFAGRAGQTRESLRIAEQALERLIEVEILVGQYASAAGHAKHLGVTALGPRERAQADRLLADALLHSGRIDEAERLMHRAVGLAWDYEEAVDVVLAGLMDLAEYHFRENRSHTALERIREIRLLAKAPPVRLAIQVDMLEGKLLHALGRFSQARRLLTTAYEAAFQSGTLSERARASNGLGNVARDQGDYEDAAKYFTEALSLWDRVGNVECMAGAHNNLGNLAMSRGDLAAARFHQEAAWSAFARISNVQGAAMAQANLAMLELEDDDPQGALHLARAALDALGSAHEWLRYLVRLVEADALLATGQPDAARAAYEDIRQHCAAQRHPLAEAGALRGLARVMMAKGRHEEALPTLESACEIYDRVKRSQEAARTRMAMGEALLALGRKAEARERLAEAARVFESMNALRDIQRVTKLAGACG